MENKALLFIWIVCICMHASQISGFFSHFLELLETEESIDKQRKLLV